MHVGLTTLYFGKCVFLFASGNIKKCFKIFDLSLFFFM